MPKQLAVDMRWFSMLIDHIIGTMKVIFNFFDNFWFWELDHTNMLLSYVLSLKVIWKKTLDIIHWGK
jgi:hypothetical protein